MYLFMEQPFEKAFFRLGLLDAASCALDGCDVDAADDDFDFLLYRKQFEDLLICNQVHDLWTGADTSAPGR